MSSISSGFSTKLGMVACGVLKNTRSEYSVTDRSAATSTNRGASSLCEPSFGVTPWHCEHQRCESAKPLVGLLCAIVLEHASTTARPIKNAVPIARISAPVFYQPHGTLLCFRRLGLTPLLNSRIRQSGRPHRSRVLSQPRPPLMRGLRAEPWVAHGPARIEKVQRPGPLFRRVPWSPVPLVVPADQVWNQTGGRLLIFIS